MPVAEEKAMPGRTLCNAQWSPPGQLFPRGNFRLPGPRIPHHMVDWTRCPLPKCGVCSAPGVSRDGRTRLNRSLRRTLETNPNVSSGLFSPVITRLNYEAAAVCDVDDLTSWRPRSDIGFRSYLRTSPWQPRKTEIGRPIGLFPAVSTAERQGPLPMGYLYLSDCGIYTR